jgi:dihydroceramidase
VKTVTHLSTDQAYKVLYNSYVWRNPIYHQAVFATLLLITGARVTYLTRLSPVYSTRVPESTRASVFKLFWSGGGLFALGFLVWNVRATIIALAAVLLVLTSAFVA